MKAAAFAITLCAGLALAGCYEDETLTGYGAAENLWLLQSIDGQPYTARATLEFPEAGTIAGQAPCNRFSGAQSAPYPWFSAERIAVTKMACPELQDETLFLRALAEMTLVEVAGDTLLLTNDTGREMVFRAQE